MIELDDDLEHTQDGIQVLDNYDTQRNFALGGIVVSVGKNKFMGKTIRRLVGYKDSTSLFYARYLTRITRRLEQLDLRVGDQAIVCYTARLDKDANTMLYVDGGRYLVCPKESVYGVIRKGVIIPQNGYLFVQMHEHEDEYEDGIWIPRQDKNKYGTATVKHVGKPNQSYVEDDWFDTQYKEGQTVYFERYHATRLEVDEHNTLTDVTSSLFKIHPKYILGYDAN